MRRGIRTGFASLTSELFHEFRERLGVPRALVKVSNEAACGLWCCQTPCAFAASSLNRAQALPWLLPAGGWRSFPQASMPSPQLLRGASLRAPLQTAVLRAALPARLLPTLSARRVSAPTAVHGAAGPMFCGSRGSRSPGSLGTSSPFLPRGRRAGPDRSLGPNSPAGPSQGCAQALLRGWGSVRGCGCLG